MQLLILLSIVFTSGTCISTAFAKHTIPKDDLVSLSKQIGDASIVGIGETIHFSQGFGELNFQVQRHLIETMGFRAIGLEIPWLNGLKANEYLQSDDCKIGLDHAMEAILFAFRSTELGSFFKWACKFNQTHKKDPIIFFGFDVQIYNENNDLNFILTFLKRTSTGQLDILTELVTSCPSLADSNSRLPLPKDRSERCKIVIDEISDAIEALTPTEKQRIGPKDLALVKLSLKSLNAVRLQMSAIAQGKDAEDTIEPVEARDLAMADMFESIRALLAPNKKAIIWAAVGHLWQQNPRIEQSTNGGFSGAKVMGTVLHNRFGKDYFLIGLIASKIGVNMKGNIMTLGFPETFEGKLGAANVEYQLFNTTTELQEKVNLLQPNEFLIPSEQCQALIYIKESEPMIFYSSGSGNSL